MSGIYQQFVVARKLGVYGLIRCGFDRIFLGILSRYFKCDPWHASAPFFCRPYKKTVVDLVNGLSPKIVVEVGCGLGDLLSRVNAVERFGYDIDLGVVRAARFLHGKKIRFTFGDASKIAQESIDVLIMVNWIHEISPEQLNELLRPLFPITRYLLLDAVDVSAPDSYRYKHDFSFLRGFAERISVTRPPDEARSFHVFKVVAA